MKEETTAIREEDLPKYEPPEEEKTEFNKRWLVIVIVLLVLIIGLSITILLLP